jgi:uncharacterized integral membrane protein
MNNQKTYQRQNNFSWMAFLRSAIIGIGVAVPLLIVYLILYLYIPGNNVNLGLFGQAYEEPTLLARIISIIIGLGFLYMDFAIGRRYYRSIRKAST